MFTSTQVTHFYNIYKFIFLKIFPSNKKKQNTYNQEIIFILRKFNYKIISKSFSIMINLSTFVGAFGFTFLYT